MYVPLEKTCPCGSKFTTYYNIQAYCSIRCRNRNIYFLGVEREKQGISRKKRNPKYSSEEIEILKNDPRAQLPNRTPHAVYLYCKKNGIYREFSEIEKVIKPRKADQPKCPKHNWKRNLTRHQKRIRRDGGRAINNIFKKMVPHSPRRTEIISEAILYIMDHRCTPEEAVKQASRIVSRFYAEEFRTCEFNDAWMQMPDAE